MNNNQEYSNGYVEHLDLYLLLEVSPEATKEDIKKAYYKKAVECHPDKNPDNPKATQEFQTLLNAHIILSDDDKRSAYHIKWTERKAKREEERLKKEEEERKRKEKERKENEKPKNIIQHNVTGIVKWYNFDRGFGVIERNDTKKDIFVHKSDNLIVDYLINGDIVEFDIFVGKKGRH